MCNSRVARVQSCADALHGIRGLVVEELNLPYDDEHLGNSEHHVLWEQPEGAHGHGHCWLIFEAMFFDNFQAFIFNHCCDDHGQGGEDEACPNSLEHGDASFVSSDSTHEGDKALVVDRNAQDCSQGVEDAERTGWNLEVGSHGQVHAQALAKEERGELRNMDHEHQ